MIEFEELDDFIAERERDAQRTSRHIQQALKVGAAEVSNIERAATERAFVKIGESGGVGADQDKAR